MFLWSQSAQFKHDRRNTNILQVHERDQVPGSVGLEINKDYAAFPGGSKDSITRLKFVRTEILESSASHTLGYPANAMFLSCKCSVEDVIHSDVLCTPHLE